MDFRKIFFGFVFLIFGSWGFGQLDSTNINFSYSVTDQENTDLTDGTGFINVSLGVEINPASYSKLRIDLIGFTDESDEQILYSNTFTVAQLLNEFSISQNSILINIGDYWELLNYKIFIVAEDSNGFDAYTIIKYLVK